MAEDDPVMATMTTTLTLTDFLLARIAEDEALASNLTVYSMKDLATCAARRSIVKTCASAIAMNTPPRAVNSEVLWLAGDVLHDLAVQYADHPDYSSEW